MDLSLNLPPSPLSSPQSDTDDKIKITIADFDGVTYRLASAADEKSRLVLSMSMPCFPQLVALGATDLLAREYSSSAASLLPQPEAGFDVSLSIDTSNTTGLPAGPDRGKRA